MANDRLTIELDASTSKLERAFANASSVAERHAKKMGDAFSFANSSLAALGVSLSVGAFASMIKGAIDAQDSLKDLSKSTSISIEDLAGLGSASLKSGGDLESIAASINKLSVNMGKDADKFAAIGVTAKDPIEAFKQLADVFVAIQDPQERAAFGAEALGKSWSGAAPLLSEGGAAIGEMVEKGKSLSKVTAESAAQADALNDMMVDLNATTSSVATQFANLLLPSLLDTAKAMEEMVAQGNPLLALLRGFAGLGKLPFDMLIPDIDMSSKGQVKDLEKSLASLQWQRATYNPMLPYGQEAIKNIDQQILVAKNQIDALKKYGEQFDKRKEKPLVEDKGSPNLRQSVPDVSRFLNGEDKPKKAGRADTYSDPLAANAEAYGKAIERIVAAQADAEKSAVSLNGAEQALHDLMASAAWKDMPQAWKDVVEAQAAASSEAIKAAESQKLLNNLLAATPTGKLVEQQKAMGLLVEAFDAGKISAVQFDEAAEAVYGTVTEGAQEATDAMDAFADQAARNMQDAFADFLFDPFKDGVDDMALNFAKALQRMLANAAAAKLSEALFGETGSGGGLGGFLGSLFGSGGASSAAAAMESGGSIYATAMTTLANAKGGVYSSPGLSAYSGQIVSKPTVFPFAKGAGLMGEAGPEAILPLSRDSKGRLGVTAQSGGSNVAINITVNEGQGADKTESSGDTKGAWTQFSGRIRALVLEEMDRQKMPGGRLYA